jgi:hypothetical protein
MISRQQFKNYRRSGSDSGIVCYAGIVGQVFSPALFIREEKASNSAEQRVSPAMNGFKTFKLFKPFNPPP